MVKITEVLPHSRAASKGVCAGDMLISINGETITDVLDYRFHLASNIIKLTLLRGGEELTVTIHKQQYDDIGLDFETPLMDKKHTCANRCIFCFIDQLPEGLRDTLYFKDDDSRLSFLHGNYITLTNLRDADIDRIIRMHISPVNISVHTTNPELRVQMMKNKRAGEVLSYLKRLADAGITLCGQIVLCRGINDGEELTRSMHDLAQLHPALSSVSIVPAGLTKYRDGLYPLTAFSPEECAAVIAQVNQFGDACLNHYGSRLFFCADEFYIKAGLPLPDETYYEDYPQIENGVGMITSLESEMDFELTAPDFDECYPTAGRLPRRVTIATGMAASMGAFLLCAGAEGMRYATPSAEIMIHQPLGGVQGQATDITLVAQHIQNIKQNLASIMAGACGKSAEQLLKDMERDNWMNAAAAKDYGLIDHIGYPEQMGGTN